MRANPFHLVRRIAGVACVGPLLALLTGCQAMVSGGAPLAQVRVITASPDVPALDIYQGSTALTYNLGFGSITSYIPLSAGTYTLLANTAGTHQTLISSKATLAPSAQYTVLIGNVAASLQQITLVDQSQPAPSGQVSLRLIDQATHTGAVDIYLVPAGQRFSSLAPALKDVLFGANTGYFNVAAGTYTIVIVPTGTVPASNTPAVYTGAQTTYAEGTAQTIVLIDHPTDHSTDQPTAATPGLEVITAEDYNVPQTAN